MSRPANPKARSGGSDRSFRSGARSAAGTGATTDRGSLRYTTTASSSIPIPIVANETRQLVSCARAVATGRPRTVAAVPPPVTSASPRPSCAPDRSEEA